jgi:succinoglycan biosynthesis transport protein ExoP
MDLGSQVYVLSSESIVVPVVRTLNLAHDPEFVGIARVSITESEWGLNKLLAIVKKSFGWQSETAIDLDTVLERRAVETFLKRLTVSREDVANVINVTFASKDAKKAADIANALADTYLATNLKVKLESNKIANQLLEDRVVELRQQVHSADQAVREYKQNNNVMSTTRGQPYSTQVANLNSRLLEERMAAAENKARLEHDRQSASEGRSHKAVPDNDIIMKLRSQYLDLGMVATEMESRVGPQHLAVVKIRKRMEKLAAAIQDEKERIYSVASEPDLAKARYKELAAAIEEIQNLRELENNAEVLRNLYSSSLQKLNELNNRLPQFMPVREARIITRAAPPLEKNSKKPLAVFLGSVVFGLLLGAGAAVARELSGGAFETPEQVRSATGVYCGIIPAVEVQRWRVALRRGNSRPAVLEEYVLDAPYSRFTETVRNIRVFVEATHRENGDKVFCVLSSVANEGKTTILTNLSALIATSPRARLLVMDCDLHRRRLTDKLVPDAQEGLIEALDDPSRLARLVCKMERSGLEFLPCALPTRIANAAELLGSPQMEKLLDAARAAYDFVIIEAPPIMSVVDIKTIERYIDRFILVVEWGKTQRRLVQEALSEVEMIRGRLMYIVLNKADPAVLRNLEAYKGARFADYYVA